MDHAETHHGDGTGFDRPVGGSAIEAQGLGKKYRRGWALRDVSFRLPTGRVCGLVGPNGAGKSTLMGLATHMIRPTTGGLRVFGAAPGSTDAVLRTAFLTQEKPLFKRFTVAETLRLGHELNPAGTRRSPRASSARARCRWKRGSEHCPAASAPASPSRWLSASARICSSSTSRCRIWTRWSAANSWPH